MIQFIIIVLFISFVIAFVTDKILTKMAERDVAYVDWFCKHNILYCITSNADTLRMDAVDTYV